MLKSSVLKNCWRSKWQHTSQEWRKKVKIKTENIFSIVSQTLLCLNLSRQKTGLLFHSPFPALKPTVDPCCSCGVQHCISSWSVCTGACLQRGRHERGTLPARGPAQGLAVKSTASILWRRTPSPRRVHAFGYIQHTCLYAHAGGAPGFPIHLEGAFNVEWSAG